MTSLPPAAATLVSIDGCECEVVSADEGVGMVGAAIGLAPCQLQHGLLVGAGFLPWGVLDRLEDPA